MFGILVLVGVAVLLILAAMTHFVFRETRRLQVLDRRLARVRELTPDSEPEQRAARGTLTIPLYQILASTLNVFSFVVPVGLDERTKLRQLLSKAGFHQPDALATFLTIKLFVTLMAGGLTGLWAARHEYQTLVIIVAGLAGAVGGGILPEMGLRSLVRQRHKNMTAALPDALDLLTLCIESGLTFERALARVVEELRPIAPDLARELGLAEVELRVGADRRTVLRGLYTRTEIEGLRDMATTIIQGERYGTPLVQSMQNIARGERMQKAARVAAQIDRLPVMITMPTMLLVMPGTVLLLGGPAFLTVMKAIRGLSGG